MNIPVIGQGTPCVLDAEAEALRKRRIRQAGKLRHEKMRLKTRLTGFNYQDSVSWIAICRHFGSQPSHEELKSVAELIAKTANIRLDRDAKRRKVVMMKWFEEHWDVASYLLRFITLEEESDGETLP